MAEVSAEELLQKIQQMFNNSNEEFKQDVSNQLKGMIEHINRLEEKVDTLSKKNNELGQTVDNLVKTNSDLVQTVDQQGKTINAIITSDVNATEKLATKHLEEETLKKNNVEIYALNITDNKICKLEQGGINVVKALDKDVTDLLNKGKVYVNKDKNVTVAPVYDKQKNLLGAVTAIGTDVSKPLKDMIKNSMAGNAIVGNLKTAIDKATVLSYEETMNRDNLTGIANIRGYTSYAKKTALTALTEGKPMCIMMIDGDKFKEVNDNYGHPVGDKVLKSIASTMEKVAGDNALAIRIGGDEFCVLVQCDSVRAYEIAESIRVSIEEMSVPVRDLNGNAVDLHTTVSVGITEISNDIEHSINEILAEELDPDQKAEYKEMFARKELDTNNIYAYIEHFRGIADNLLGDAKEGMGVDKTGRAEGRNLVAMSERMQEAVKADKASRNKDLAEDVEGFMFENGEYELPVDQRIHWLDSIDWLIDVKRSDADNYEVKVARDTVKDVIFNALDDQTERNLLADYFQNEVDSIPLVQTRWARVKTEWANDLLESMQNYGRPSLVVQQDIEAEHKEQSKEQPKDKADIER